MSKKYAYNSDRQGVMLLVNFLYKIAAGFVLGAGIAGLFMITNPAILITVLAVLGILFAGLWGIKEFLTLYRRNIIEEAVVHHANAYYDEQAERPAPFQKFFIKFGLISSGEGLLYDKYHKISKYSLKVTNVAFNVITILTIALLIAPMIFINPGVPAILLIFVLNLTLFASIGDAFQTYRLKSRVKHIHDAMGIYHDPTNPKDMSPEAIELVFEPMLKRESNFHRYIEPFLSSISAGIASAGNIFGILSLFLAGVVFSLTIVPLPLICLIAVSIGLVAAAFSFVNTYRENKLKVEYLDYASKAYAALDDKNDLSSILSFTQYQAQRKNDRSKGGEMLANLLVKTSQLLDGMGIGTGLALILFTVLFICGIMVPPVIMLSVIVATGLFFATMNYMRLGQSKEEQRENTYTIIDDMRAKLPKAGHEPDSSNVVVSNNKLASTKDSVNDEAKEKLARLSTLSLLAHKRAPSTSPLINEEDAPLNELDSAHDSSFEP